MTSLLTDSEKSPNKLEQSPKKIENLRFYFRPSLEFSRILGIITGGLRRKIVLGFAFHFKYFATILSSDRSMEGSTVLVNGRSTNFARVRLVLFSV